MILHNRPHRVQEEFQEGIIICIIERLDSYESAI
jgi:hypothetical protein